jgi:hypothetical protein
MDKGIYKTGNGITDDKKKKREADWIHCLWAIHRFLSLSSPFPLVENKKNAISSSCPSSFNSGLASVLSEERENVIVIYQKRKITQLFGEPCQK